MTLGCCRASATTQNALRWVGRGAAGIALWWVGQAHLRPATASSPSTFLHPSTPPLLSQVWIVEDGTVERYDGDFEEYKEELIKEIAADMDEDEKAK